MENNDLRSRIIENVTPDELVYNTEHCHNHKHHEPDHDDEIGVGCSCCGIDLGEEDHTSCCGVDLSSSAKNGRLSKYWMYIIISLPILVASYLLSHFDVYHSIPWSAVFDPAWVVVVLCGLPIYRGAYKNLKRKKITAALLISIAMTASIIMGVMLAFGVGARHGHGSYIFAAGEIAFLMTLGQQIEGVTSKKSRSAVKALIDMTPVLATLKTEDGYVDVNVDAVSVGDTLLTRPYETIALDGIVVKGNGEIDTSSITGEYAPMEVKAGDRVYAGTKNLGSSFEIQATSKNTETTLSKLIAYVKQAEKRKAPFVRLADKWASCLVPSTCVLSVIVFFISLFALETGVLGAIQRAITVLIVVCPCAMTLATPIAVAAGIGNASKKGMLVKSGTAFEALSKIDVVCLDKTGTLTEGKPTVEDVVPYDIDREELLYLSASAESHSEHLIGKAIVNAYDGILAEPEQTESQVGIGITAIVNGKKVEVVKLATKQDVIPKSELLRFENTTSTAVAVFVDDEYKGVILISDTLRTGAQNAINAMRLLGLKLSMLTGDNTNSANKISSALSLDDTYAELLPEDKVNVIERYKKDGKRVLMIGDGVNDAPSMGIADTSLAMGAMGNNIAIETADVSLLSNDLSKVPFLIKLSRVTFRLVKCNILLSLCVSLTAVILSTLGLLDAVSGALVHNASSVYVCLSASLLLLYNEKRK